MSCESKVNRTVLDLGGVLMNGDDVTLHAPAVTLSKYTVAYYCKDALLIETRLLSGSFRLW